MSVYAIVNQSTRKTAKIAIKRQLADTLMAGLESADYDVIEIDNPPRGFTIGWTVTVDGVAQPDPIIPSRHKGNSWLNRIGVATNAGLLSCRADWPDWSVHADDVSAIALRITRRWYVHQSAIASNFITGGAWAGGTQAAILSDDDKELLVKHLEDVVSVSAHAWYNVMQDNDAYRLAWKDVSVSPGAALYSDAFTPQGAPRMLDGQFIAVGGRMPLAFNPENPFGLV